MITKFNTAFSFHSISLKNSLRSNVTCNALLRMSTTTIDKHTVKAKYYVQVTWYYSVNQSKKLTEWQQAVILRRLLMWKQATYTLFLIRTSNFRLRLGCEANFWAISASNCSFKSCSYFLIFPNSGLVARNNKKPLRNTCLLLFYPAPYAIKSWNCQYSDRERDELAYHSSSTLCTRILKIKFLNLSDQNFSLVSVLSLFLF